MILFSVLAILFCFWPLGLLALIKAVESRTHYRSGRYDESDVSARYAKKYLKYSVIVGVIIHVIWVVLVILSSVIPVIVAASTS